jgi:hypothetical protein
VFDGTVLLFSAVEARTDDTGLLAVSNVLPGVIYDISIGEHEVALVDQIPSWNGYLKNHDNAFCR